MQSHHIKNNEVETVLLERIQAVFCFVKEAQDRFIEQATTQSKSAAEYDLRLKKQEFFSANERVQTLDRIIRQLYEDNISGKVTDERFQKLTRDYEREQEELEKQITVLEKDISKAADTVQNIRNFIKAIHRYQEITELSPELLHDLIEQVEISVKENAGQSIGKRIRIIWNYIGQFTVE